MGPLVGLHRQCLLRRDKFHDVLPKTSKTVSKEEECCAMKFALRIKKYCNTCGGRDTRLQRRGTYYETRLVCRR